MCLFRRPVAGKTRERQPVFLYAVAVRQGLNKACRESCCSCHGPNSPSPLAICWKPDCSAPPQPNLETLSLSEHRCCHIFQLQDHFSLPLGLQKLQNDTCPKTSRLRAVSCLCFHSGDFFFIWYKIDRRSSDSRI